MEHLKKILAVLVFYVIFLLFFLFYTDAVIGFEKNLFFLINNTSNPFLDSFFIFITYFGSSFFWIFLIILFWFKRDRKIAVYLLYAFIVDSLSLFFLKWLFMRPRPPEIFFKEDALDLGGTGPGLPSGHSERVFSGAVILSSFYKKMKIPLYILALLVAFSRIYIGVHYPIDALIGTLNGIIIGYIVLNLPTEKLQKKLEKLGKKL
jgi:undecaprenyl-diphosphatase